MSQLKLYVWENCFHDYTAGLGVVLARDSDHARKLLAKKIGYDHPDLVQIPKTFPLTKAKAFFVHGGG